MKFLKKMSSNIVVYLAAIFAASIVLVNLVLSISFNGLFSFNKYSDILIIMTTLLVIGILIWWGSKIDDNRKFLIVLFSTSFIIRSVWVLVIKTEPTSDFAFMYEGAQNIANGNYEYILSSAYFKTWVYQLGFTMYLVGIIKVFGDSILIMKFFNIVIVSLIPVIIYLTAKKLGSNKGAKIASLAYCFYTSSIVSTSVLTNQHLATLMFYAGIYLLISNIDRRYKWILVGLMIGIGDVIRPEGSIVIIAILLFVVFKNLLDYRELGRSLVEFIGIIIVITLVSQTASFGVMRAGVSKDPLINKDPLWKFVCGLNPNTKGSYSEEDDVYLSSVGDTEARAKAELGLIKERLSNPTSLVKTMAYKTAIMWGANDTSMNLSLTDEVQKNKYIDVLTKIEKIQYMILMIMFLGGTIIIIIRKEGFKNNHIFLIIFIGYFLAHLLIEVQPRYRYFAMPIIFIVQAEFLGVIYKK